MVHPAVMLCPSCGYEWPCRWDGRITAGASRFSILSGAYGDASRKGHCPGACPGGRNSRGGGDFPTVKAIAEAHGLDPSNVRHAFNLAFLSPRILEAIAAGRDVPPDLSVARLLRVQSLVWDEQERELGFSG